eukprot:m.230527 g.230527  ORF g.230527 m.230527 type:complete len:57 (-) comp39782_c0_seq1:67-237(-)
MMLYLLLIASAWHVCVSGSSACYHCNTRSTHATHVCSMCQHAPTCAQYMPAADRKT